jgi:Mg/Co/Ni transporter MgtE
VVSAATVGATALIADVQASGPHRFPVAVVNDDGVLLGAVDPVATSLPPDTPVDRVMVPAPGTIRPELRVDEVVERLRRDTLAQVLVTAVNGVLMGRVVREDLHA